MVEKDVLIALRIQVVLKFRGPAQDLRLVKQCIIEEPLGEEHVPLQVGEQNVRLKAEGKDAIFWGSAVTGFGVRVHTTGRKLYIVQSRGAGLRRVTLGRVGDEPVDKHRREAAAVIDQIKRGEEPFPPEPTVADLAEHFPEKFVAVRCKPRTAKNYRLTIRHQLLPALGTKALKEVGPEDVTALHHVLWDRPAAANQAMWVLSKMFKLAESWGMVPPGRRPTRHVRRYRDTSCERFLTLEEYRHLGDTLKRLEADGSMMPSALAAIRLLMLNGCRSDETVPWILRGAKDGSRLACLSHHWRRIKRETGLRDVRVHDLSHAFTFRALALGRLSW